MIFTDWYLKPQHWYLIKQLFHSLAHACWIWAYEGRLARRPLHISKSSWIQYPKHLHGIIVKYFCKLVPNSQHSASSTSYLNVWVVLMWLLFLKTGYNIGSHLQHSHTGYARLAQFARSLTANQKVPGSIPCLLKGSTLSSLLLPHRPWTEMLSLWSSLSTLHCGT